MLPRNASRESSEHYRKAHARDGINEMHPLVLNRRISNQESGEMEASRAEVAAAVALEDGDGARVCFTFLVFSLCCVYFCFGFACVGGGSWMMCWRS